MPGRRRRVLSIESIRRTEEIVRRKRGDPLYHRSCLLGSANGCTNYAAPIWTNPHTDVQLACAQRTFEKACKAKEPFACGMVGRLMFESQATPDQIKEGRRYLETACDELEGFPCRVLAKHLESGMLGDYDQRLIRTLLRRPVQVVTGMRAADLKPQVRRFVEFSIT